jgi:hypothetical protein
MIDDGADHVGRDTIKVQSGVFFCRLVINIDVVHLVSSGGTCS